VQKAIPYSLFAVVSDSMVPTFKKGDLIFTSKQSDYAVGDIIVFTSPLEKNKFISHRVVNKVNNSYQTKGDNNAEKDIWTIKPDQVVGKETFQLSDLGVVVTIPQSILGSIFFLIIPCTIIIFSTIQEYWKRIVHFLDRFKKEP
jgi:signal peptidase